MSNLDFKLLLYNNLPEIYQSYDKEKGELKRFLNIFGEALNYVYEKNQNYIDLYDVNNSPTIALPYLAETLGFKFHIDMTEAEKRKFLKILPKIYSIKGNIDGFEYLARETFDKSFTNMEMSNEVDRVVLRIYADIISEDSSLSKKIDYYKYFAEMMRPINTHMDVIITNIFRDVFDSSFIDDHIDKMKIKEKNSEKYTILVTNPAYSDRIVMKSGIENYSIPLQPRYSILNRGGFKLNTTFYLGSMVNSYDVLINTQTNKREVYYS